MVRVAARGEAYPGGTASQLSTKAIQTVTAMVVWGVVPVIS
jgi:hypothetical protein